MNFSFLSFGCHGFYLWNKRKVTKTASQHSDSVLFCRAGSREVGGRGSRPQSSPKHWLSTKAGEEGSNGDIPLSCTSSSSAAEGRNQGPAAEGRERPMTGTAQPHKLTQQYISAAGRDCRQLNCHHAGFES